MKRKTYNSITFEVTIEQSKLEVECDDLLDTEKVKKYSKYSLKRKSILQFSLPKLLFGTVATSVLGLILKYVGF